MNVSFDGHRPPSAPGNRTGSGEGAAARPTQAPGPEDEARRWTLKVEARAARWQAALGGFRTGAPPAR